MFTGKFAFEGDEVNPNNEPDEKGEERRDLITTVTHDPADRQADGRWEGTIIQNKVPVREIRWAGLYGKNSDKLYAPNNFYLRVTMMQEIGKYLRDKLQIYEVTGWSKKRN